MNFLAEGSKTVAISAAVPCRRCAANPMTYDDPFQRILQQEEAMRRALSPFGEAIGQSGILADIGRMTIFDQMMRESEKQRRLLDLTTGGLATLDIVGLTNLTDQASAQLKLLAGPIESLRHLTRSTDTIRALADASSSFWDSFGSALAAYEQYEKQFRLPELIEASRLASDALAGMTATAKLCGLNYPASALETAMQSMHAPWLSRDHVLGSAQAFAAIQAIGHAVNVRQPYEEGLSAALRLDLGDWRAVTVFPSNIFEKPVMRSDFYVGLGFNPSLTDFTALAFDETTALAGLGLPPREREENDEEEAGLVRTNAAHDQLQRFERDLRIFIDKLMMQAFGASWVKNRTPEGMFDEWTRKRTAAIEKGEAEQALIFYADFSDYTKIIERKDNWAEVFEALFHRKQDVQESFVRLFPIRICTMHARIITLDDELLLRVETRRILRVIETTF
jgi:hypothetical protein